MYGEEKANQERIRVDEGILKAFLNRIDQGTISELCLETGLPYDLLYNLAHGRIRSLSPAHYRILFGEEPPEQVPNRMDGTYFRGMVRLWLFLNDRATKKNLFRELYPLKASGRKPDYRVFDGTVKSVEKNIERRMEEKFLEQDLSTAEILQWIQEMGETGLEERIPYKEIKPVLDHIAAHLKVHPSRILNQWFNRYESGELGTVSRKVYERSLHIKDRTDMALRSGSRWALEKLKEEVCGKKEGFSLFSQVEEELEFLQKCAGSSLRPYLGRSLGPYKRGKLKRIASWRVKEIRQACHALVRRSPGIRLNALPPSLAKKKTKGLLSLLAAVLTQKIMEDENREFEKLVLNPATVQDEGNGFEDQERTSMNTAAQALGISKLAFDLLVASNREIFRMIAFYDKKWYLPNAYVREMREKEGFRFVAAKYETLANRLNGGSGGSIG